MSTKTSLQIQFNIIVAIVIKEIKVRFGTKKLSYIWIIIEPLLQMLPLFAIRMALKPWNPYELMMFLLTGIVIVRFFIGNAQKIKNCISASKSLLAYHNVKPFDIALSRLVLEVILTFTIFTLIFAIVIILFDYEIKNRDFPLSIFAILFYFVLTFSWGVIFMITSSRMTFLDNFIGIFCRMLYFISGVFFSVKDLPPKAQELILYNPILHVVEIQRYNLLSDHNFNYGSISYIGTFTLYSFIAAMILYHFNKHKLV